MRDDFNKFFQAALKHILKEKGYGAQSFYARKTGIKQQYISAIKNGTQTGSEATRRKIAEAAGYTYDDFFKLGRKILYEGELKTSLNIPVTPDEIQNIIQGKKEDPFPPFKHTDWAKKIIDMLLAIEKSPKHRTMVEGVIGAIYEQVQEDRKVVGGE